MNQLSMLKCVCMYFHTIMQARVSALASSLLSSQDTKSVGLPRAGQVRRSPLLSYVSGALLADNTSQFSENCENSLSVAGLDTGISPHLPTSSLAALQCLSMDVQVPASACRRHSRILLAWTRLTYQGHSSPASPPPTRI